MRHQNCDIDHPNIASVRECIGSRRRVANSLGISLITPKQKTFLLALMEQTDTPESELPGGSIDGLTKTDASAQISRLQAKKKDVGHGKEVEVTSMVPQGTYTVVFDSQKEDRITVRFRVPMYGRYAKTETRPNGTQIVEYLYGPDNERSYRRFANWTGAAYRIWTPFSGKSYDRLAAAISALADPKAQGDAGYLYSLESSKCYRCGRKLTVPASIHRGLGPDCASQIGVA